jgi:hypothetical protein
MTRHRYHLTPHAMDETIPLRTGIVPKFNKVFLTEIEVTMRVPLSKLKANVMQETSTYSQKYGLMNILMMDCLEVGGL